MLIRRPFHSAPKGRAQNNSSIHEAARMLAGVSLSTLSMFDGGRPAMTHDHASANLVTMIYARSAASVLISPAQRGSQSTKTGVAPACSTALAGGDERHGRDDHLVPSTDSESQHPKVQRSRAGRDATDRLEKKWPEASARSVAPEGLSLSGRNGR